MHRIPGFKSLAALAVAVLAPCGPAFADFQTVTATLGERPTDYITGLVVPPFTESGTLTSVSISLADHLTLSGSVTNTSGTARDFSFSEDTTFTLSRGGTDLLTNALLATQQQSGLGSGSTFVFTPSTSSQTVGPYVLTSGLDAFSSPVDLQFSTSTSTTIGGGGGNNSLAVVTTAGATVTVTYTYTPNGTPGGGGEGGGGGGTTGAVPEPSSIALTLLGMAGLGVAARVRGRKPAR